MKEGDRVYLKTVPKKGERKKLQPLYKGPYRVIKKIGEAIFKVVDIATGKETLVHTNRIKVCHKDALTVNDNKNVRTVFAEYRENEDEDK